MDVILYLTDIFASILKMNRLYEGKGVGLAYDLTGHKLRLLEQKYNLSKIAGDGTDFKRCCRLLHWVYGGTVHAGDYDNSVQLDAISLLDYGFEGKNGLNCRALATVLTECLLAVGIYARTVYLMPFAPYDTDNHVVTHAYLGDVKGWVMLDPTFNCYCLNENKMPLDIVQMRTLLSDRSPIFFNDEIGYNGEKRLNLGGKKIMAKDYCRMYFAKNLFYCETAVKSCYFAERKGAMATLVARGYDVRASRIGNIEFRIDEGAREGVDEAQQNGLREALNRLRTSGIVRKRLSVDGLLAPPF